MNPMKQNPIAKFWPLRRVFSMPKMFHKAVTSPSSRSRRQVGKMLSSKFKRAVSWSTSRSSRIYRGTRPNVAASAISADISRRSSSSYVANLKSLPRASTGTHHCTKSSSAGKYDKSALSRTRSLPEWKTQGNDLQITPSSGPVRYNFWPLSPR
ncbi:hypothetical protein Mapa_008892 [Marchantia paleacea]|nr:hypothetical protein Mapa_008892 [Marchantia paleacea]